MGPIDLETHPGHLFRRVQQVHTQLWTSLTSEDVTPPQFAVLNGLAADPGIDQRSLASTIALDRSTAADVIARLVKRGLVQRERDHDDARRNVLRLTEQGVRVHDQLTHRSERMIEVLLSPLAAEERNQLLDLLNRVAEAGEQLDPHEIAPN